jgi:hypothetical protein
LLAAALAVVLQFAGANCAAAKSDDLQANPVPAIGQNAKDQKAFDPAKKGPRVLFAGNSITLHGPRPQIGWTNNWGMAASARDKDYVHLLQKKIAAVRPDAQCCLLQVANTFERAFFKKDWSCERDFRPKLDAEKESVAKKRGDVFVNMEDIRVRRDSHGRFNHPGDLGMNLIAERFWQHIEQRVREIRR